MPGLYWLPPPENWEERTLQLIGNKDGAWEAAVALAKYNLDFVKTVALDTALSSHLRAEQDQSDNHCANENTPAVRLAVLGSSTLHQLYPGIRIAAVRRGIRLEIYHHAYGQYRQEILDRKSGLHQFSPDIVLIATDSAHLTSGVNEIQSQMEFDQHLQGTLDHLASCWATLRESFQCHVIQQLPLQNQTALSGNNEHRMHNSAAAYIDRLKYAMQQAADHAGADLLSLDRYVCQHGLDAWYSPSLWNLSQQEITPIAGPFYGDLVLRTIAANRGKASKCLVLDLDNTLWGGEVGEDDAEGLQLGSGSASGEAFRAFQLYIKTLADRGVILAVCSKNDLTRAKAVFSDHPEMILKLDHIACFIANWLDKPDNLRTIAAQLNIALDSMVFVDDSPFERALVRRTIPEINVIELPDDPALYSRAIADSGYFEANNITTEDTRRTMAYQANAQRTQLLESSGGIADYLKELDMQLACSRCDPLSLNRITQLVNKTNQFNLTGKRYNEQSLGLMIDDKNHLPLQMRLTDRFGDNGLIAIVLCTRHQDNAKTLTIDNWLMSCRVLGRTIEVATMGYLVDQAKHAGIEKIVASYHPTARNEIVKDHYNDLGFKQVTVTPDDARHYELDVEHFVAFPSNIQIIGT